MTHINPRRLTGWKRLLTVEPALVRGVIGALVSIGLIWGVDFTGLGEQVAETADILGGLVVLLTAWWTRSSVTPSALVVEQVEPNGRVIAGEASPLPTGQVITRD